MSQTVRAARSRRQRDRPTRMHPRPGPGGHLHAVFSFPVEAPERDSGNGVMEGRKTHTHSTVPPRNVGSRCKTVTKQLPIQNIEAGFEFGHVDIVRLDESLNGLTAKGTKTAQTMTVYDVLLLGWRSCGTPESARGNDVCHGRVGRAQSNRAIASTPHQVAAFRILFRTSWCRAFAIYTWPTSHTSVLYHRRTILVVEGVVARRESFSFMSSSTIHRARPVPKSSHPARFTVQRGSRRMLALHSPVGHYSLPGPSALPLPMPDHFDPSTDSVGYRVRPSEIQQYLATGRSYPYSTSAREPGIRYGSVSPKPYCIRAQYGVRGQLFGPETLWKL
ncbi:hypothetical protein C8F01DRAFT_727180 [Mycena amicta]|nr:hypothetical protein C8F01DRAFT_727180 [Mycena amicta]